MGEIGSLFAGIGGLELGLEAAGLGSVVWQVEQDPFCRAVLAKHWPTVDRSITDVRAANATNLWRVDLICGGFPCQDVSGAGAGAGLGTEDAPTERSGLWFEFRRIVGELRPRLVVVENVASGKRRWLCRVRADLHALGYRTRAIALSAADVGAPHLRRRIFVVAHADGRNEQNERQGQVSACDERAFAGRSELWSGGCGADVAHRDGERCEQQRGGGLFDGERATLGDDVDGGGGAASGGVGLADAEREQLRHEPRRLGGACGAGAAELGDAREAMADADEQRLEGRREPERGGANEWPVRQGSPTRSDDENTGLAFPRMGRDAHGLSAGLDGHRWPAPRGAGQYPHEPPRTIEGRQEQRRARLKALGNAVVPQCGLVIGRMIIAEGLHHG